MTNPEVSGLTYYPIKGAAATAASEVVLTSLGIEYDREWIVCSPEGSFMSQRKEPELARVSPTVADGRLTINAPGMETLAVELGVEGEERPVEFFKKAGTGITQGAEAAEWFSDYLHKEAELLRIAEPRPVKEECRIDGATTRTGFADAFPLLVVSEASLAELNTHLESPVPIDRFRGNIVIKGDDLEPYDEDYWREVRIGDLTIFIVRACARCPVPNTDQATGKRLDLLVTAALKKTRKGIDPVGNSPGVFFGQNALHVFEPGVSIQLGDSVVIEERADERNVLLQAA